MKKSTLLLMSLFAIAVMTMVGIVSNHSETKNTNEDVVLLSSHDVNIEVVADLETAPESKSISYQTIEKVDAVHLDVLESEVGTSFVIIGNTNESGLSINAKDNSFEKVPDIRKEKFLHFDVDGKRKT